MRTLRIVPGQTCPIRFGEDGLGYRPMPPPSERTRDSTEGLTSSERTTNRVTVADAARLLGLSAEAVRMRIKRGTLASEKVEGSVYVILDADQTRTNTAPPAEHTREPTADQTNLVEALRSEVEFLREELQRREEVHVEENRRRDSIIAALTQRIPELDAPSESRDASETAREEPHGAEEGPQEQEQRRSWLYRFFFGP